jgi:hypothetical protein
VLDVAGFTLVQRDVRTQDRVTMFGTMEAVFGVGLFLGSLAAPALVALVGARGGFVVGGALLLATAALTYRPIAARTRPSALTPRLVDLFRSNPLFAPLPLTALEHLAEQARPAAFDAGTAIMRKGEPGETYLLVAEGRAQVADGERVLATCGPGEGVGEIALLRSIPRTATVTAETDVAGFELAAAAFLSAVAGPTASAAADALVVARLERSRTTA